LPNQYKHFDNLNDFLPSDFLKRHKSFIENQIQKIPDTAKLNEDLYWTYYAVFFDSILESFLKQQQQQQQSFTNEIIDYYVWSIYGGKAKNFWSRWSQHLNKAKQAINIARGIEPEFPTNPNDRRPQSIDFALALCMLECELNQKISYHDRFFVFVHGMHKSKEAMDNAELLLNTSLDLKNPLFGINCKDQ